MRFIRRKARSAPPFGLVKVDDEVLILTEQKPQGIMAKCVRRRTYRDGRVELQFLVDCPETGNTLTVDETTKDFRFTFATKADRCVICGGVIPEGRQVCTNCERGYENECSDEGGTV